MQDPIADMLCRIRNGQQAKHKFVTCNSSNLKMEVVRVLKEEGYIDDYHVNEQDDHKPELTIKLKYYHGVPVIDKIKRISRPGLRQYRSHKQLTFVSGFGIAILTTSKGVMSHKQAKDSGIGGEIICEVA